MDLSNLNDNCIKTFLKMMNLQTLIRVRKVNKYMDNFVEKNRFGIKAKFQNKQSHEVQLILKLRVHAHAKTQECALCKKHKAEGEVLILFYVSQDVLFRGTYYKYIYDLPAKTLKEVRNPFHQLSAVHFDHITMSFDRFGWKRMDRPVYNELLSTFRLFKFSCDWFSPQKHKISSFENLLKFINFNNFWYSLESSDQDVSSWPIQHCQQVFLGHSGPFPPNLDPVLPTLRKVALYFNDAEHIVKTFLINAKRDRKSRGILREINLIKSSIGFDDIPGFEVIYRGETNYCGFSPIISKVAVDGGVAYNYYKGDGNNTLQFWDEECDPEALHTFLGNGCKTKSTQKLSKNALIRMARH